MDVVSTCPLSAWGFVWQTSAGATAQTVVVKATFQLAPGESVLAKEQDGAVEEDEFWDDDPTRSVRVASDKVPYKARADVMLVGHAYAPEKQPVRSLPVRLVVGELDKSIEVWCDRVFRAQDGQLLEGQRFVKMPLRWERAAGGPETNNPVGLRFDAPPNSYGMIAIPNLQPPGMFVSQRSDTFVPVCFAPIGGGWPSRVAKLGPLAGAFASPGWEARPLPQLPDYGYFQAAPPDQQLAEVRPNERLVLENLHPEHPRLVTSLPGIRPVAMVERGTGEREPVAFVADTMWIDTDRGVCVVVWRGRIGLRHAAEAGRIVVTLDGTEVEELDDEDLLKTIPPAAVKEAAAGGADEDLAGMTLAPGFDLSRALAPVMPFLGQDKPQAAPAAVAEDAGLGAAGLPFGKAGGLAALREVAPAPPASADSTLYAPMKFGPSTSALPAPPPPAPVAVNLPPPVAPPPMVTMPPAVEQIAPAMTPSQWAAGSTPSHEPGKLSIGQRLIGQETTSNKGEGERRAVGEVAVGNEPSPQRRWKTPVSQEKGAGGAGGSGLRDAVLGGAVSASNAAADAQVMPRESSATASAKPSARVMPKEIVELLWFDPACVPRLRRKPAWKEIMSQVKPSPTDDDYPGEAPSDKRQELRERREVFGLLARGTPIDAHEVDGALVEAVRDDGTFVPPIVLVGGTLEFPFDELETLRATIAAVAPLATGDKRLSEAVQTAQDLLKTPWLTGASSVTEGQTAKLKEIFTQGNRALPPRYLENHTERMLLEQRAHQRRTLFGSRRIRGLLSLPGTVTPVPVYLPEECGQRLPSVQRITAKLLAEVHVDLDQYETHGLTLIVLCLGRLLSGVTRNH
ncbi:DUF2169 family type VI secretion system accessory protein [Polyangium fumosum]|uniref:DUF2169 domain-containing protein n=1 Tax=Polyangium fumosum TaxID=889272 RepID=A0A4U1JDT2_9BACT|nr:DUF2169 domain-containing protein [Polyangium fumosum]TKD09135.1 DUF2169 domain-containing protein [Polyangium fumosum]